MMKTPASWQPDPWQRAQYRYFDGADWTGQVSTNGQTSIDNEALAIAVLDHPGPPLVGLQQHNSTQVVVQNVIVKRRHFFRWLFLGVIALIVVGIIGAANSDKTPTVPAGGSTPANTVSKGAGARDASADVANLRLGEPDAVGWRYVTATITNNSSKRSNYLVSVAIESADGKTQFDTAMFSADSLEPGQSTEAKGLVTTKDLPADAVVSLKEVTRLAD